MSEWHWRNTQKPVRFFIFDARAGLFLMLLLVHFRLWTLALVTCVFIFFWLLERRGLSFAAALRAGRLWVGGRYRPAWLRLRPRQLEDTGTR